MFLAAVSDVAPLDVDTRDRVRLPAPPPSVAAVARKGSATPPAVALQLEPLADGALAGRAPGVNRAQLAELRAGRLRVEDTLDLHGLTTATAAPALRDFLLGAAAARRRCVLVVHGRGAHSGGVAVLRELVMERLTGELSGLVRAFCGAAPHDGGPGATYVELRS